MHTLVEYYEKLLQWEGREPRTLAEAWPVSLLDAVINDLRTAVQASKVKGKECPIRPGSSNQSIGNQVEDFVINELTPHTMIFEIRPCGGAGYPDKVLRKRADALLIPLEVKATSGWNASDSNRRVLTSSSEKLQKVFKAPVHHMLMTILYKTLRSAAGIEAVRLDFLEPSTPVNIRLEASVNHKILETGSHRRAIL